MKYDALKARVCEANKDIQRIRLSILTWGNASEVDRDAGVFAIKPSGVDYDALTPDDIVVISLDTGKVEEGALKPSSDTPTHGFLYQHFPDIGGIVHTHSPFATSWAQAQKSIPCLGTTHADAFRGPVPCTRTLTAKEVEEDYELNTGRVIVEHFEQAQLEAMEVPGVLVAAHAPFAWAASAAKAVVQAQILEEVAKMAATTLAVNPSIASVDDFLLDKHFLRKHGANASYGQN